jgi:hypothetical protein
MLKIKLNKLTHFPLLHQIEELALERDADFVTVHDGIDSSAPVLAQFTGHHQESGGMLQLLVSTQSHVYLLFTSSSSSSSTAAATGSPRGRRGFSILYKKGFAVFVYIFVHNFLFLDYFVLLNKKI